MIKEYRAIYTVENTSGSINSSKGFHGELFYVVQKALMEAKRLSLVHCDEKGPTKVFVDTLISGPGRINFAKEVKHLETTPVQYMVAGDGRIFVESSLAEQLKH